MCGIVGFVGKQNKPLLTSLLNTINHRGRDDRATYFLKNIHMGMNRLAIVDLRLNLYPIRYKHYVLLYNGEIYNHQSLRAALKRKKISPPDGCDAYVILPLYDLYGAHAFSLLEGMFAISIFDEKKNEIVLARDKSGEKPLYYTKTTQGFAYGSEIRAVLPILTRKAADIAPLIQYLAKGYVHGNQTLAQGVQKVQASECVVYQLSHKKVLKKQYWSPKIEIASTVGASQGLLVERLRSLVKASVRARMLSDVPVGCFLSGGIDSTLITYFASQTVSGLRTYSVAFPNHQWNDESIFARHAVKMLKTNHTEVVCTPQSVRPIFENLEAFIDEPISDPAIIPTLLLSKEARKSVTVVLTGEGADELFAGYPRYLKQIAIEYVQQHSLLRKPLLAFAKTFAPDRLQQIRKTLEERYVAQRLWSQPERSLLSPLFGGSTSQIYYPAKDYPDMLLRMQLSDWRGYLAEQLFMKADKSTMAYNLESRAPYMDTDLMNFAFSLPRAYKIRWFQGKYLLKRVAASYFPAWFVWRPKHGFSVPLREWFCSDLKEFAQQSVELVGVHTPSFDKRYYKVLVDDHLARRADNADKIWSMLILTSWLKHHHMSI